MKKLVYLLLLISFGASAQKISQLPAATTVGASDLIHIVQGGVNKKAAYSLFGGATTTYVTQTGPYTPSDYTATDGVCQDWVITGNSTNTISFPTGNATDGTAKWVNGNGVTADNTKVNYIYTCAKNGHIIYNTIKLPLPAAPDVTAPVFQSAATNTEGTIITLTYNEALSGTPVYTVSGGKTISSQVISGSTVVITVTVAYANGNVITVSGGGVTDASSNAVATLTNQSVTNNVGAATVYLLANTTASRAYSLRKVKSDYTGFAVRVRRNSDNVEQDFGFSGENFDIAAFNTFVGAGIGFVTIWYDQSGNAQNAIQTTVANQPHISPTGLSGKPTVQFDGVNDVMTYPPVWTGASARSMFVTYKLLNATGTFTYEVVGQHPNAGTPATGTYFEIHSRTENVTGHPYLAGFSQDLGDNTAPNLTALLASAHYDGTTAYLRRNGAQIASGAKTFNTGQTGQIGGKTTSVAVLHAQVSEIIIYNTYVSGSITEISNNTNAYYTLY